VSQGPPGLSILLLRVPSPLAYLAPVKLSVKSDYAARAVTGLARQYHSGEALKVEELAAQFDVPANYLVQILIELKGRQIVKSIRGKEGGYMLARPPAEITLGDVIRAIHGQVFETPALTDQSCPPELRNAWKTLQAAVDRTADSVNFQQLLDQAGAKEKMYYI
jgi:Rrf2 family transcriptional regulator, cysteine metabolism repressor